MLKDFIQKLFTEMDNRTPDLIKIMAFISILSSWVFEAFSIYKGQAFDAQSFGISQGALFASVGVALGFKKETPNANS